ncbi:alpha/beta fold hydrolase [Roseomonas nepalensis]|uniref:Alpha/beta fold hydrolase n=1 Tax=Muricoccus nepalensis TaxID=1854500 RepID=A0A502GD57_9PROT|nr:alpha/beta fold hydrolase [Roseomonas nepalensis]TPG59681.1 alpha/beta fold hydrolase [Roseomonas nepalensis]
MSARLEAAGIALLHRSGPDAVPPLVLLHGIGSNAESWRPLMGALPEGRALWAWNAPGYGGSAPVAPAAPTPGDYAAALARLLDALGLDRIVLAGHSLGCLFAARFAARHPARVARLALMSPALGYGVTAGPLPPAVQARIDDLSALGPTAFAERRAARLVHDAPSRPAVLEGVRRAMAAVDPAGYAQAVHALGAGDLLADAARLAMPVLVATGLEDVVTPPDNARRLHAALPNPIRLAEFPAAGHALPQEFPAEVAALLAETILA